MFHMTRKSSNKKTGRIPVTTSGKQTCPDTCPLKDSGCYAKYSHLGIHWDKVTAGERGTDWAGLCDAVEQLPAGQLWRHNQAGDLPHRNGLIDHMALGYLIKANKGKRGFTYTHHKPRSHNVNLIRYTNDVTDFTINMSADNLDMADEYQRNGLPTVVILPADAPKVTTTPQRNKVVRCPANPDRGITCESCGLCAKSKRDYIIGFPAHGTGKAKTEAVANGA